MSDQGNQGRMATLLGRDIAGVPLVLILSAFAAALLGVGIAMLSAHH